jgi:hypothetical protein
MACAICEVRKPKRFCPGVRGEICSLCCGTEREVTVHCPLDCAFLQDARKHDKIPPVEPDKFPNQDIRVTDEFLHENEELLVYFGRNLMAAALETPGAVDGDVREALEALIRTYRTLESGVYYETRPQNPLAGSVYARLQNAVTELRRIETENRGVPQTRDKQVLGLLVFLQRLEIDRNNGRRLGRAFLDFLREFFVPQGDRQPETPSLIVP